MLEAFVGPCPKGMVCCHNDGDPTNNRPGNLRWDSYAANFRDAMVHGTIGTIPLTTVLEAARLFGLGMSAIKVARELNIDRFISWNIKTGRNWSSVTGIPRR